MKALLGAIVLLAIGYFLLTHRQPLTRSGSGQSGSSETAQAPATSASTKIICPACNAEGYLMVRRGKVVGTLQDTREQCPLCHGTGYHTIPAGTGVCPDCLGMGKRMVHPSIPTGVEGYESALAHLRMSGYPSRAPTSTGCVRCIGKGYLSSSGHP